MPLKKASLHFFTSQFRGLSNGRIPGQRREGRGRNLGSASLEQSHARGPSRGVIVHRVKGHCEFTPRHQLHRQEQAWQSHHLNFMNPGHPEDSSPTEVGSWWLPCNTLHQGTLWFSLGNLSPGEGNGTFEVPHTEPGQDHSSRYLLQGCPPLLSS